MISWAKYVACCFIILSTFSNKAKGQGKIYIDKAKVSFTSNAPLEIIKASSDQMRIIIDPVTNQVALTVPITSFKGFNSGLQREHFNEKYMESEKFPAATFKGKIIEKVDFTMDGTYDVRVKGDLEIHGQKQSRIIKSKIVLKNKIINVSTEFIVPLADHNISVPKIISEKIATEIDVTVVAVANQ